MEMFRNLNEKLAAKFPAHSYSMVKIACLDDAFSEIVELEASQVEGQSLQQKDKKRREKNLKNRKAKRHPGRSLSCPESQNFET